MNINFRQPKFVLPVIMLPFFCLFFYVWRSSKEKQQSLAPAQNSLNHNVGGVSGAVRDRQLADKLDAYRNTYKEADGLSAIAVIPSEKTGWASDGSHLAGRQQSMDSIQQLMGTGDPVHSRLSSWPNRSFTDSEAAEAAAEIRQHSPPLKSQPPVNPVADPMNVFRQQMSIMDSVNRQNDPVWKEQQRIKQLADQRTQALAAIPSLTVTRTADVSSEFNTVMPENRISFISAVIDENVTGYAGSRIRLKLLDNIKAGGQPIAKDSYLYAQVTGFSGQRISLAVTSILSAGKILPVRLEIYDQDGLPGLYVPASAFREFTKDIGGSSVQGISLDGGSSSGQFMMSTLDKFFQSTSSAIAGIIRKNKARLQFNTFIYLIDPNALQHAQKNY